jgi:diguanylate cyclase (GGDEF)-like protein
MWELFDPARLAAGVAWVGSAMAIGAAAAVVSLRVVRRRRNAGGRSAPPPLARDPLTGLITRAEFEALFDEAALECDHSGGRITVLYVGLDNFRTLNDGYGHAVGDAVLVESGARLASIVDGRPLVSRLAGDEFALLWDAGPESALQAAEQALGALQRPFRIGTLTLELGASIGIAVYPEHGSRPRLIPHAALAMRSVKLGGGNACAEFHPSMAVDARDQVELLQDLRHAIEGRQLQLVYQPKVDARSLQVTAAEALLRWQHPRRGYISPEVFIRLAERHGLISTIGRWVIDEACQQAAAWRERGLRMRIAINLSGHQMRQDDLVDHIEAALRRHAIPPGRMTCEITESVAMEDTRQTHAAFERLRAAGLHVSIDDFGTGHSSLALLRRLPAAELKIDRAFVTDLAGSEHARSIVQAVIQMAHTLGLRRGRRDRGAARRAGRNGLRRAAGLPVRQADERGRAGPVGTERRRCAGARLPAVAVPPDTADRAAALSARHERAAWAAAGAPAAACTLRGRCIPWRHPRGEQACLESRPCPHGPTPAARRWSTCSRSASSSSTARWAP